jgi:transposase
MPLPSEVWERSPPEAQAYIRAFEARVIAPEAAVQQLETSVRQLEATVQGLPEQLRQDSRTSSRPPSSDPPHTRHQRPRREPGGRRPGGQPRHEGRTRGLVPVNAVTSIIPITPARCRRGQHPLQGRLPSPSGIR